MLTVIIADSLAGGGIGRQEQYYAIWRLQLKHALWLRWICKDCVHGKGEY